jgi:predicted dehydrogenase
MRSSKRFSRRDLVKRTIAAAGLFTFLPSRVLGRAGLIPPSDKLNIAFIGIGCQGFVNLKELASQNIVAVCDVDWRLRSQLPPHSQPIPIASEVILKYPGVKRFDDWRIMLDKLDKELDAVVVCTPDHSHALAAITAVKMRKHTYCEKPLAHSIEETRAMMKVASEHPHISTHTGLTGHASEDVRSIVEWVQDGAVGVVQEVRVFQATGERTADGHFASPDQRPSLEQIAQIDDAVPVPPEVKWDLWVGPAPMRNYNPMYLPLAWRNWRDFGSGVLGDHGPHFVDPAYWALDLVFPESIQAETAKDYDPKTNTQAFPRSAVIRFKFPARGDRPGIKFTWYAGDPPPIPQGWDPNVKFCDGGGIIIGTKGTIVYGPVYSSPYNTLKLVWLLPSELDKSYKRPAKTLARPSSHWMEWAEAAKVEKQTSANWNYGGMVTQICLLGNIAIRHKGQELLFDPKMGKFTNSDTANALFGRPARPGWELPA